MRDASGVLITDFTALSSLSGFDYTNAYAVPILSAARLFGSDLIGLIGVSRNRKNIQQKYVTRLQAKKEVSKSGKKSSKQLKDKTGYRHSPV